jgi:hypothetical protein
MTTITNTGLRITTYRVSFYDQFVVIMDYPGTRYPRRWALWDDSTIVPSIVEYGMGDPPARLFPTGVVPVNEETS